MGEWGRGKVGRRTGRGRRSGNYGQNIIYERRIHEKEKDYTLSVPHVNCLFNNELFAHKYVLPWISGPC